MIDWSDCPEIERTPGKLGGKPAIKHSRVRPDDLIANEAEDKAWLADAYGVPLQTVRNVLTYYHQHQGDVAAAP